jgi:hypothetical protein
MVHRAQLENMQHVLIRLQRWIRRVLGRERVRLASVALLMALHPRLGMGCALGELGHDILEALILAVFQVLTRSQRVFVGEDLARLECAVKGKDEA